jgi:hypothetical protein
MSYRQSAPRRSAIRRVPACVAWEGSGAAGAALFGSLEIRAATDAADQETPRRFDENLPIAMSNLASLSRRSRNQTG